MELDDDLDCNPSDNPELTAILSLSRRQVLQGALGAAAVTFLGGPKALFAQATSRMGFADDRGIVWIQTDISTSALNTGDYANIGNNMMLAADPATGDIRRFLTGPRGCEVTGVVTTPDGRSMFVSIQHPGEPGSGDNSPHNPAAISSWPDGPGISRPRSATVVIRRTDGGIIGS